MVSVKVKGYLNRYGFTITGLIAYLPVLGGIIGPMIMMAGAIYWLVYFTWFVFLIPLTIPVVVLFPDTAHNLTFHFLECFIKIPGFLMPVYQVLPFILTGAGLFFFLYGVLELAKAKKRRQELTRSGIYRIVRHPQNLGLIVILLGLTFFIFQTWLWEPPVVRAGDIYSWLFFSFIWLIEAKWEEEKLVAGSDAQYLAYQKEVPFLIPFGKKVEDKLFSHLNPNWSLRKRVWLWIGMYTVLLITTVLLMLFFDLVYWTK